MSSLKIYENLIHLETNHNWSALELDINGAFSYNSKLPVDYMIRRNLHKMIILKFNGREESLQDLFQYNGSIVVDVCKVVYKADNGINIENAKIINGKFSNWQDLNYKEFPMYENLTGNEKKETWDGLSTKYNKITRTKNFNPKLTKKVFITDADTGKRTMKSVDVFSNVYKNKITKNNYILGNQVTKGKEYRIKGKKAPYNGLYHINTKTLKAMTGEMPTKNSEELIKIKKETKRIKRKVKGNY